MHEARALGLYTDLYELRMVDSYIRRGMTAQATFSLYIRPTPERPWFVALGAHRVVEMLEQFRYGSEEIEYLRGLDISDEGLEWLEAFEPSGEMWALPEGCVFLADEPIVEFTAPLPVGQLIETAVINLVQYPTLIATKAARIALAAQGRPVVDFGFRRAHGLETGVVAAAASYVGGGMATSNVEAGRRHKIPVVGTMAHSYVQAHEREVDAFESFAEDHPEHSILLVDTYDTLQGVRNAIEVGRKLRERGHDLAGVRLDSGDLAELARGARRLLDEAGFQTTQIFASGGLDEPDVAALVSSGAPIDAFGVGTDLVVSRDRPALDIAYKLVSYDGRPVAKQSTGKKSLPGAKQVFRQTDLTSDVLALREEELPGERLLEPVWRDGKQLRPFDIERARERAEQELRQSPTDTGELYPRLSAALRELAQG